MYNNTLIRKNFISQRCLKKIFSSDDPNSKRGSEIMGGQKGLNILIFQKLV